MIGITPMIGYNDPDTDGSIETFTLSDASSVLSFAQTNHVGELSFWAVSRDNGSCPGSTASSDTCDGLSQSNYAFTGIFEPFSGGSSGNPGGPGSGYYYVKNLHSGLVLDDTNGSTSNGTQIQQWAEYSGDANQEWTFVSAGSGYYYIKNLHSGLVLDDTGWSTSNGTIMQQWAQGNGQANQEWSLQSAGNGYYYIQNRYSGLVLDDTNGSTSNGTLIQQWAEYSGNANQEWYLQSA